MKNIYLFLAMLAVAATGCSDDDSTVSSAQDNVQILEKTIKYVPSKQAFDNGTANSYKNVQYYAGLNIVADSTYNPTGVLIGTTAHTYTSDTYKLDLIDQNVLIRSVIYTYDSLGRIIMKRCTLGTDEQTYYKYTYNESQVTCYAYDPNTDALMPHYTQYYPLNSLGLITFDSEFEGQKLVKNNIHDDAGAFPEVTLSYYGINKPANMLRNVHQLNNLFIEQGDYRTNMAENNNYYLHKYSYLTFFGFNETVTFTSNFDSNGYITYCKGTGYVKSYQADRNFEIFYYYL